MRPTCLGFKNPKEVVQAPFYVPEVLLYPSNLIAQVTKKGNSLKYAEKSKRRPKSSMAPRFASVNLLRIIIYTS
jgi:hypothetical protein